MISIDRQTVGRTDEIVGWKKWLAGALCAVGLVAGATAADAQTRTLRLMNVHTGEKAEIVYRRGSSYDTAGLKKANYILRDWRKNQPTKMNPKVLDVLWEVYRNTGASGYIHVICGYRSPGTNSMLRSRSKGVAKKSQHMLGNAIDYYIPGVKLKTLRNTGLALQAGGVGYYPSSGSPFVHMDVGRVRHWGPISDSEVVAALRTGKRMGKSGVSMAAFADDTKRSPGLLARLFGGGADEEEDNAESGTRSSAPVVATRPAKVEPKPPVVAAPVRPAEVEVAAPAKPRIKIVPPDQATPAQIPFQTAPADAVPPEPEEVVETPETIIAALPARKVPKPMFAPRPQADVAPVEAETASATQVAELIEQPETALPAKGDAPLPRQVDAAGDEIPTDQKVSVVPESKPTEVALGIPLPTWRPQHQPEQEDASALLALASLPDQGNAASDAIAGAIVPTSRPDAIAGTTTAEMTGAIPVQTQAKQARVAVAAPVKTTRKSARPSRLDSKPDPKPVVVAAEPQDARWAIDKNYVTKSAAGTKAPSYAHNIVRTAPLEVYTAGFQTGGDEGDINRFSGKAVKFLQVARFQSK